MDRGFLLHDSYEDRDLVCFAAGTRRALENPGLTSETLAIGIGDRAREGGEEERGVGPPEIHDGPRGCVGLSRAGSGL